jgi:hypothetical protein
MMKYSHKHEAKKQNKSGKVESGKKAEKSCRNKLKHKLA